MAKKKSLTLKTLREQVYDYVREALNRGDLVPGESLSLNTISEKLGVSKPRYDLPCSSWKARASSPSFSAGDVSFRHCLELKRIEKTRLHA